MKGSELLRQLKVIAARRGVAVSIDSSRGKGSHQTLRFGDRKALIPDLKKELKEGTRRSILKSLGFTSGRLEDD